MKLTDIGERRAFCRYYDVAQVIRKKYVVEGKVRIDVGKDYAWIEAKESKKVPALVIDDPPKEPAIPPPLDDPGGSDQSGDDDSESGDDTPDEPGADVPLLVPDDAPPDEVDTSPESPTAIAAEAVPLDEQTKKQLVVTAEARGIDTSGNKTELLARLKAVE